MTTRPDAPGPNLRRGPRPLLLHLTLAMLRSSVSRATSLNWRHVSPRSSEAIKAALKTALGGGSADSAFSGEVVAETLRQDAALISGIAAYRRHPWQRTVTEPPTVWAEGGSRLLDYGAETSGIPVLFVPSLINRAYVLDLTEQHSMLRWLAAHGIRPLLLDWGWPGELERRFTVTDYVAGRMERALTAVVASAGGPVILAGYCMGGTLGVAAAQRRPDLVRALVLLAAPWDFHAGGRDIAEQARLCLPLLEPAMAFSGTLSIDLLQVLFTLLDPWGVGTKYRAFTRLDPAGSRAELFVALEDWLNDGVPLSAPVARTCLAEWYGENAPVKGEWRIAGLPVDPTAIRKPTWIAAPARDRIVPPGSAQPLARLIERSALHEPAAGHIGMVAGSRAERVLWRPLADWIKALS